MSAAGLVAASSANFDPSSAVLTISNADYVKSGSGLSSYKTYQYTWTKTKVNSGDTWYVRSYVTYTLDGTEHTVYGNLVTYTAE